MEQISPELLLKAINIAQNAIIITNDKADIIWVNDFACTLTKYSKEELIGQNPRILQSGKINKKIYKKMWKTLSNEKTWQGELINKKKRWRIIRRNPNNYTGSK